MSTRRSSLLLFVITTMLAALLVPARGADAQAEGYTSLRKQTTAVDFAGSSVSGTVVGGGPGGAEIRLAATGLARGNGRAYGPRGYHYGTLVSPVFDAARPFDTAIASWNATTPAGTWIQVELRAFKPGAAATRWYNMGVWASGTETIKRRSAGRQRDARGQVNTDTLLLAGAPAYARYQYRLMLFTTDQRVSPTVRLMAVLTSNSEREQRGLDLASDRRAWGVELPVPMRSQMIYRGGGEVWCSPTSTSMALAYWGYGVPVPTAAAATYDYVYTGNGNWPFNTAWAGTFGLESYVTRMGSMAQIEQWILAGVPVIISHAYNPGELPGAPLRRTAGHIMVIRGFDAAGNVIANDPAARTNDGVRIVYDRATLERLWLTRSRGTVYLIYPRGHAVPTTNAFGSW